MTLHISSVFTYDDDAGNYIQAVEGPTGDNQALEPAVRQAINNFVVGCKQDGIWTAIKASCILAGARTLAGALVPLVGTAPTNNGPFVAGDYNRKTGLVGDGSTKYLNTNKACSSEAQNDVHGAIYANTRDLGTGRYLGSAPSAPPFELIGNTTGFRARVNANTLDTLGTSTSSNVLIGVSRNTANSYSWIDGSQSGVQNTPSAGVPPGNYFIFYRDGGPATSARLAFYSIGKSIDLAKLDARVTDLINAFAAAIP